MLLVENKKAKLNFEILEKFFAGVVLKGFEVKALKLKKGSLKGSYISIKNNEAFLVGATISPYQERNVPTNYNPQRERKLLLKKKEIIYILSKKKTQKLILLPLSFFLKRGLIKLEFALAKPLRKYDKREKVKEKEEKRKLKKIKNFNLTNF
ncbi:SsrA-binding protein SmpB [bacterium]|nr:SsrA-binding protein SmpB [bacterium]